MRLSEFIEKLNDTLVDEGDVNVLWLDGDQPVSEAPVIIPADAHLSAYYNVLPDAVYGERGREPQRVVFIADYRRASSIKRNFARAGMDR
jgi:hypothetical protein